MSVGPAADPTPGRSRVGTFVAVPEPALAEALASAFDVLVLDLEHGSFNLSDAQTLMIAIQSHSCCAYVRVAGVDDPRLAAVLDAGADGVIAPMLESVEGAREFAARMRFPPSGRRGFGPRRSGNFGRSSPLSERQPTCAVQLETPAGVEAAAEIAAAEGVNLVIVGCSDLALALGTPGRFDTSEIRNAVERVGAAAEAAGMGFGIAVGGDLKRIPSFPRTPELLLYGVDLRIYVSAADATAAALRGVLAGGSTTPADKSAALERLQTVERELEPRG